MASADNILVYECNFKFNKGLKGGGIALFIRFPFYLHYFQIQNSNFFNNYAKDAGGMFITSYNL